MEKYPRGRRGSPAKGVGRDERREGSNPSFSAIKKHNFIVVLKRKRLSFDSLFCYVFYLFY